MGSLQEEWKMKRFAALVALVLLVVVGFGCRETDYVVVEKEAPYVEYIEVEVPYEVEVEVEVLPPLLPPQGFKAWAEDGQAYLEWLPSQDITVVGYVIYRSTSELEGYEEVAQIDGWDIVSYVDEGLENGTTYYYGIAAFDDEGFESEDMNPEIVWATARPEGSEAELSLSDEGFVFVLTGFDFAWFKLQKENDALFLKSLVGVVMQDMGYTSTLFDIGVSPIRGFISDATRVIKGHTYVFRMSISGEHFFAKIRISDFGDEDIVFDWAVQLQPDNPELAPKKRQMANKPWGAIK